MALGARSVRIYVSSRRVQENTADLVAIIAMHTGGDLSSDRVHIRGQITVDPCP